MRLKSLSPNLAVADEKPWVITYEFDARGGRFVTNSRGFASYQEALEYLESQKTGNHAVISPNPFISPVPMEAIPDFRLVYSSIHGNSFPGIGFVPEIKIFEYAK